MHRKFLALAGAVAVIGALGTSAAASAAPMPVPKVTTQNFYSENLAGYVSAGNGLMHLRDVRATVPSLPAENSLVPPDTIGVGFTLEQNVATGGDAHGIGYVWGGACGPGLWTLEAGDAFFPSKPQPVDVSALTPLLFFGSDVCKAPGQGGYLQIHYSRSQREILYISGDSQSDSNVLRIVHGVLRTFRTAGIGVDTTSGADAATLTLNTLASFDHVWLTEVTDTGAIHRVLFNSLGTYEFTGTQTGGAPSVTNPVTLTPSAFSAGSAFTVTVP